MVSGCLRNDRTLPTYPELTCSEGGLLPSDRNSGKSRDTHYQADDRKQSCDRLDIGSRDHGLETKG